MEILAAVTAIVALYIAYQQWRTNSLRLRHDLYDRRLKVYYDLIEFLSKGPSVELEEYFPLTIFLPEGEFLFGDEIIAYLEEVRDKIWEIRLLVEKKDSEKYSDEEREEFKNQLLTMADWRTDQYKIARQKFAKYLRLHQSWWY